jgi:hypothetical protein
MSLERQLLRNRYHPEELRSKQGCIEQLGSEILWMEGLWVRTSVKVEITKEEKRLIGRPSSPRWEIDIVAYSGRDNLLYAVECKSYLDSRGVRLCGFDGTDPATAERYKLFCDDPLREAVFSRLKTQFAASRALRMYECSSAWPVGESLPTKTETVFEITSPRRTGFCGTKLGFGRSLRRCPTGDMRTRCPPWLQSCCCAERLNRDARLSPKPLADG